MKISTLAGFFLLLFMSGPELHSQTHEYYQIKIYTFDSDQQQKLTDEYLANAYLPALHRLGINSVGVFKTRPEHSKEKTQTFVLIPLSDLSQLETIPDALAQDRKHTKSGKDYLTAPHNEPPYARIESIVLRAFDHMPQMKPSTVEGPRKDRIYELRSYEGATEALHENKVEMFNKGGEIKIFEDLGFNAVFYGQVLSGCHMPNLMYMTTFKDQESRDTHWDAFRNAPEWHALKNQAPYQNNVSGSETFFLYPTAYSDY